MLGFFVFYFVFSGIVVGSLFAAETDNSVAFFPYFLLGWLLFPILLGLALQKFKNL
jgi:hypothetical protein